MFWRGVLGYLPVNIVQGVTGLLGIVLFTRLLPPAEYGIYALAFSVMSLVHTLCFTWLEAAMARFYAAPRLQGRRPAQPFRLDPLSQPSQAYWRWPCRVLQWALGLWLWPMPNDLKIAIAVGHGLGILDPQAWPSSARSAELRGRRRQRGAAMLDIVMTGGRVSAVGRGPGLGRARRRGALAARLEASSGHLPDLGPAHRAEPTACRRRPFRARPGQALPPSYGLPELSLVADPGAGHRHHRSLRPGRLSGRKRLSASITPGYSIANRTLDVMFIWLGMAGGPAAIMALERGGKAALNLVAREQAAFMVALTLPSAVGLALVARPLAAVMIGPALREGAAQVTPWIAASGFFAGVTTYYFHTAFTLGRQTRLLLLAMAIPAATNLALTLILIPRYGLRSGRCGRPWPVMCSVRPAASARPRPFLDAAAAALEGLSARRRWPPQPWGPRSG